MTASELTEGLAEVLGGRMAARRFFASDYGSAMGGTLDVAELASRADQRVRAASPGSPDEAAWKLVLAFHESELDAAGY